MNQQRFTTFLLFFLMLIPAFSVFFNPILVVDASPDSVTLGGDYVIEDGYIYGEEYYRQNTADFFECGLTANVRRAYVEWDISSIPDNAIIINTIFKYNGESHNIDCHIHEMLGARPSTSGNQAVFDEAGEGTVYYDVAGFPVIGVNKEADLGPSADSDLQSQLSADWFAIGFQSDDEGTTAASQIRSEEKAAANPKPTLYVEYTVNPAPETLGAQCEDPDDTDNIYAMRKYYDFKVWASDGDGYADIDRIQLSICDGTSHFSCEWDNDVGFSILSGSSWAYLDAGSSSHSGSVNTLTVHFKIKFDWDYPDGANQWCYCMAYDESGQSDGWNAYQQTLDFVSTVEVTGFSVSPSTINAGEQLTATGTVKYEGSTVTLSNSLVDKVEILDASSVVQVTIQDDATFSGQWNEYDEGSQTYHPKVYVIDGVSESFDLTGTTDTVTVNPAPNDPPVIGVTTVSDTNGYWYSMYTTYSVTVPVTDAQGYADIVEVRIRLGDSNHEYKWSGTSFTEITDVGGYYTLQSGGTYGGSGNTRTVVFKLKADWACADGSKTVYAYAKDSGDLTDGWDDEGSLFTVESDLQIYTAVCNDYRVNYGSTITVSGTVRYQGTGTYYPPNGNYNVQAKLDGAGGAVKGTDTTLVNGAYSMSVTTQSDIASHYYYITCTYCAVAKNTPSVVTDRIEIYYLQLNDARVNGGTNIEVKAKARLDYDDHALGSGDSLTFNSGAGTWDSDNGWFEDWKSQSAPSDYTFTVSSGSESTYGITTIWMNIATQKGIWDRIEIYYEELDDSRVNINDNIEFRVKARLDYDNHALGSGDSISANFGSLSWDSTNGWFDGVRSQGTVGDYTFTISSGSEATYGITTIWINTENPKGIWDRIKVTFGVDYSQLPLGDTATFTVSLVFDYDESSVTDYSYNINRNDTGYGNPHTTGSFTDSRETEGKWLYDFTSVTDSTYGITSFVDPNDLTVEWIQSSYQLTIIACEYDNSTALQPTSETFIGVSNSSGSFIKQVDSSSQVKFTGQSSDLTYFVLWYNSSNTGPKVYEESISSISSDISKNAKCKVWDLTLNTIDKYSSNNLNDAGYFLITFPNSTELARGMSVTGSCQFKAMNGSYTITTRWHGCTVNSSWVKSFDPSISSQNVECDVYTSLGTITVPSTGNGSYLTKFNATSFFYCGNSSAPFTSGTFKVFDGTTEIASQSISDSYCIATSTATLHGEGTLYFNVSDGVAYTRTSVSLPYNISVYGLSISYSASITEGDALPITFSWAGNASIDYPNYMIHINQTRVCYQVWKGSNLRYETNSSLFALFGSGSNSTTLAVSGLEAYSPYVIKAYLIQVSSEWTLDYVTGSLEVKEKTTANGGGGGTTPITVTGSTVNVAMDAGTSQTVEISFTWSGVTQIIINQVEYGGSYASWASTQDILPKKFLRTAGATPYATANLSVLITCPMSAPSGSVSIPYTIVGAEPTSGTKVTCNGYIQIYVTSPYEPKKEWGWIDWLIMLAVFSPIPLLILWMAVRKQRER